MNRALQFQPLNRVTCKVLPSSMKDERAVLNSRHPVAAVFWHQVSGYQQDDIHNPPDAHTTQGEQLANCSARVSQAEAVHP